MTEQLEIQIQAGLPEALRPTAARLYYDAFGQKLGPIVGRENTGVGIIRGSMNAECCISAIGDHALVGVTGYYHDRQQFVSITPAILRRQFGWLSGWARYVVFAITNRRPRPGELVMDGIAVHPSVRGQGVGTRLLTAVYQFAGSQGYRSIRLDVVDTNPDARRLYERVGFVASETHAYPFLKPYGFTAVTTMIRSVPG